METTEDRIEMEALLVEYSFHKEQEAAHEVSKQIVKLRINALMGRNTSWLDAENKCEVGAYRLSLVSNPPRLVKEDGGEIKPIERERLAGLLPAGYTRTDLNTRAILAGMAKDKLLRSALSKGGFRVEQGTRYDIATLKLQQDGEANA